MNILVLETGISFVARLEAAGQVVFTSHFYDSQAEDISEQVHVGEIEGEAFVSVVASPTGKRVVKEATFYNPGGSDATLVLAIDDGTSQHILYRVLVGSGGAVILSQLGEDVTTIPGLPGQDGASPEFREHEGYIQWRFADQDPEAEWENLFPIPEDGSELEMRVDDGKVQWRLADQDPADTWKDLFDVPEDGANPEFRVHEGYVQWRLADQTPADEWENLFEVPTGEQVQLRWHEGEIQWKYESEGEGDWKKLVEHYKMWLGLEEELPDPLDHNVIYFIKMPGSI